MTILLHIVFGLVAFAGSIFSASAFGDKFAELTTKQKWAIALSYVGIMGSTILGFASTFENPMWMISITAVIAIITIRSFFKSSKKSNETVEKA